VPLFPPKIPHDLIWGQIWDSEVGIRGVIV
jgi:hypothetical protein